MEPSCGSGSNTSPEDAKAKAAFIAAKEKQQQYFKENASACTGANYGPDLYYPIGSQETAKYPRSAVPSGAII